MAQANAQNVPPQSRQKDNWDRADTISRWISAIALVIIPIAIGVATYRIQKSIARQLVTKDYLRIATTILERPKSSDNNLRDWAVTLLNRYSPLKFTPQQEEELKSVGFGQPSGSESVSALSLSPDGKKLAVMKTKPLGNLVFRHDVELYDIHTQNMISQFEAGVGAGGIRLVWSQDGSKLLADRSHSGVTYLVLFDVVQGKLLGGRVINGIEKQGTEGLRFSEDGQNVIMERTDGKSEVWQLP